MLEAADPSNDPLDTHAESAMRHRPEAAQVEIPLERFLREVVILDALQQHVVACESLTAADDLAYTFRREHVDAQREFRAFGIGFHVERLHTRGVAMNRDRPVEVLRQYRLVGSAE